MLYKITHDQSTSSPEEDQQYAVETSPSTSRDYIMRQMKNLAFIVIHHQE